MRDSRLGNPRDGHSDMVIVRLVNPIRMVTKGYQRGCTTGSKGIFGLSFDAHVADASNQVIGKAFTFIHSEDFDCMGLIVRS